MLFDNIHIRTEQLENSLFTEKGVSLYIARLDKIHPVVSGNKLFKLHFFLQESLHSGNEPLLTFGGAYSNHLVATAFSCKNAGIKSIGIVRGEEPASYSHTLIQCREYGMQLKFISREEYKKKEDNNFIKSLLEEFGDCIIVPEGGFSETGAKGASLIMNFIDDDVTHICSAVGTSTTIAGLLLTTKPSQQLIAVPVLKGLTDIEKNISLLTNNKANLEQLSIFNQYHFGGYAKYTPELIAFMNTIYEQYQLPTDFVYTAKMLFGIFDGISNGKFPAGSKIVCLHTGGLQGNDSLAKDALIF